MHILVLGGNGFIGSHFVDLAVCAGHEVSVLSRRAAPVWPHGRAFHHLPGGFEELLARPDWLDGIDAVCHAAWSSVPKTAAANPLDDVQTNVVGTLRLLEMLRAAPHVGHLMFLSSGGAVYGNVDSALAIQESQPLDPIGAYGLGKLAVEKYCQMHGAATGLPVTIIRPSNPYGPGQAKVGVLGFVSTMMHHALQGSAATIFGDGSVIRDFFDVRDLARLMVDALENPAPGTYNCGSGRGVSLAQVIDTIEEITQRTIQLQRLPERPFDPHKIVLDTSKAHETFEWSAQVDLETGIRTLHESLIKKNQHELGPL